MQALKRDREVEDEQELVALCEGEYARLATAFTLTDGSSMRVKHLCSYTEDRLLEEVEKRGGERFLVLPWLDAANLRPLLRGYQSPVVMKKSKAAVHLPRDVDERAKMLRELVQAFPIAVQPVHQDEDVVSDHWPLFDRVDALESIQESAQNNHTRFEQRSTQKQLYKCVVITGAAGTGKTRLCGEACSRLAQLDVVQKCHAHRSVFVTFLNGEQITTDDSGFPGSVVLGLRVARKLFPILGLCTARKLDDFRSTLGGYIGLCDFRTVMRLFGTHYGVREEPVWLTLALDEALFAEEPKDRHAPRVWPQMMDALMSYVIPSQNEEQSQLIDRVIVFPILSSTWTSERTEYHVSPGTKVFPILGPLSEASFNTCMGQLGKLALSNVLQKLLANLEFRRFLMTCSVAPRSIAMALECAAQLKHAGVAEAISQICHTLSIFYKRHEIGREVLEYALSGVSIPENVELEIDGRSFAHWLSMGFASGAKLQPMAVPFPLLYNDAAGGRQWIA